MVFNYNREEILGAFLALAAACLYCCTYLAVQIGNTNVIDFHVLRNLILVAGLILPKLCQEKAELLPSEKKPRVKEFIFFSSLLTIKKQALFNFSESSAPGLFSYELLHDYFGLLCTRFASRRCGDGVSLLSDLHHNIQQDLTEDPNKPLEGCLDNHHNQRSHYCG